MGQRTIWVEGSEMKQSGAQIEALAEICAIGVTFPVRTIEVHNGYMFLAARGIL